MKIERPAQEGRDLWIGAIVSLCAHALVFLVFAGIWIVERTDADLQCNRCPVPDFSRLLDRFPDDAFLIDEEDEEAMEVVLEQWDDDEDRPREEVEEVDQEEEILADASPPDLQREEPEELPPEEEEEEEEEEEIIEEVIEEKVEEEEEKKEEEEEEEEEEQFDEELMELYAVEQETNEVEPKEDADHISDQAHRTDEETIADTTTLEDSEPPEDELEAPLDESETDLELAMASPEEWVEPDLIDAELLEELESDSAEDDAPEHEEIAEESDDEDDVISEDDEVQEQEEFAEALPEQEYRDPSELFLREGTEQEAETGPEQELERERLFGRDASAFEESFGSREDAPSSGEQAPSGRRLLTRWQENEEALRASMENFLPHVDVGNHTSVNAREAAHASYIAGIHRHIHVRWAMTFLPMVQDQFSIAHPLNDMSLRVVVEIVIDADTGEVLEVGRVQPSGNELYDAEALSVALRIGTHPDPPPSIVSHDGRVYIHWSFWRDARQCGTFGVRIYRIQDESQRRVVDEEFGEK